jgi:glucose/arabinose dehydrogenase
LGLAFHPEFSTPATSGFGKIYTYTSEPVSGAADFTVTMNVPPFDHQAVIAEWALDATDPNVIDPSSRLELLRIDQPQFNHDGGMIDFGPDGLLYISLGDGGGADDNQDGHGDAGNGQDNTNVLGSILRIDVDGSDGFNGQYGTPVTNPFDGSNGLKEIYAYWDHKKGCSVIHHRSQNPSEEFYPKMNRPIAPDRLPHFLWE